MNRFQNHYAAARRCVFVMLCLCTLLFVQTVLTGCSKDNMEEEQLEVTPENLELDDIGKGTLNITSNTKWSVSTNADWLSFSTMSGVGNGSVTVSATGSSTTDRIAIVAVKSDGIGQQVKVTQKEKDKTAEELIVGEWHFSIIPEIYGSYSHHPVMVFFENDMFYEFDGNNISREGYYSVTGNNIVFESAWGGSYFDSNLFTKLYTLNEDSFVFQVGDYVYKGVREDNSSLMEDAVRYRNNIIGLWLCNDSYYSSDIENVVEIKKDGSFEYPNGNYSYKGVYCIFANWIMFFETTGKCSLNGLWYIPHGISEDSFSLWEEKDSRYKVSFKKI